MTAIVAQPRRLAIRLVLIVPGLALAVTANVVAADNGLGLVPVLAFGIVPHLPALAGIGRAGGGMGPGAVRLFNALHHPAPPIAVFGVAATGILPAVWLVAGLAWLGHIVMDLGLGDGLRAADGRRRQPRDRR